MTENGRRNPSPPLEPAPSLGILAVDDEPFILATLLRFFHHTVPGAPVQGACTAAEGLAQLAKGRFGVVVSDYRMPDMDGIEFLSRCAKLSPGTRRILFTAYADPALEHEARERAGISAFVPKGQDPQLLVEAVHKALEAIAA